MTCTISYDQHPHTHCHAFFPHRHAKLPNRQCRCNMPSLSKPDTGTTNGLRHGTPNCVPWRKPFVVSVSGLLKGNILQRHSRFVRGVVYPVQAIISKKQSYLEMTMTTTPLNRKPQTTHTMILDVI